MIHDLSDEQRNEGGRLVESLRGAGADVYAAFWIARPPSNEWRFVIVTPEVVKRGPRSVLRQIADAIKTPNGHAGLDLFDVEVLSPQNPSIFHLIHVLNHYGINSNRSVIVTDVNFNGLHLDGINIYTLDAAKILDGSSMSHDG